VFEANRTSSPRPRLPEQVITRPQDLAACCEQLAACRRFGLDTEFVGEDTYHPSLCLIQVATEDALILIDPLAVGPLDAFWQVVVDPANLVIVHAGREEVRLCHVWSGGVPGNLFDLQIAAGLVGLPYPLSHGALVSQVLGIHLRKGETLTEWRNRPLTREQIHYAYDDVRYLLPVWEVLSGRLDELGRLAWAKEEFDRLKELATPDEPAELLAGDKWRKLRGLGSLDRRRLALVRALYAWREAEAARVNRPARTVIRDDLLVEIARRNPSRERELQVVRGLPRRNLATILEVVTKARALPIQECPEAAERELELPQAVLLSHLLSAVFGDLCARLKLAPTLVASGQDIKALVRSWLQEGTLPDDSLLTGGWRASHVLPELRAVLEGRRSVRVADVQAAAPFAYREIATEEHG
jgi:ribonuclease D